VIALTVGGIGGIAISKDGLGKWMLPYVLAMHLPIIGFVAFTSILHRYIMFMLL
jgi:PAT family beta-lactamase induction signal transducer AmpG